MTIKYRSIAGHVDHEKMLNICENKSIDYPCKDCVTLAMCINKDVADLMNCPKMIDMFYTEGNKLTTKGPGMDPTEFTVIVEVAPINTKFWIQRNHWYKLIINAIRGGDLNFEPHTEVKLFNT